MTASSIASSSLNAATCVDVAEAAKRMIFRVRDYDLAATLTSGQAFRWQHRAGWWEGVIGARWLRLRSETDSFVAETAETATDWRWLADYLQVDLNLGNVLATFPDDEPMRAAVDACRGLRLLRQDPWECLASFICSSTKRIVQIQEIVGLLCERLGEPVLVPHNHERAFSFPAPEHIAAASESELRACKTGFRAPNLRNAARMVADGEVNLARVTELPVLDARSELMRLPGVGRKIADCVLLFACGFQDAFPVDVWVMKALRRLYFSHRRASLKRLQKFAAGYFGPYAGYAQQYLFHYARVHAKLKK